MSSDLDRWEIDRRQSRNRQQQITEQAHHNDAAINSDVAMGRG